MGGFEGVPGAGGAGGAGGSRGGGTGGAGGGGVESGVGVEGGDGRATDRVAAAGRLLEGAGIHAPVRAVGVDGEIVAVTGPAGLRVPLARLAPKLQALGFRYVALEPEPERRTTSRDT